MPFDIPLTYWTWAIAAVVLIVMEIFLPGIAFLWLGIAAGVMAAVVFFLPDIGWSGQFILYAILAVISVFLGRKWFYRYPIETMDKVLNRRGEQYVGRFFVLETAIANGRGKLHVDDTTWAIEGPDLPAGTKIKITKAHNVALVVEAA